MDQYKIFPLGDSAVSFDFGNRISEAFNDKVIAMHQWLQANSFAGLKDIIVAYSSLSVIFDPVIVYKNSNAMPVFYFIKNKLEEAHGHAAIYINKEKNIVEIPVCYHEEFGIDLYFVSEQKKLSVQEIIALHTSKPYRIYMIGFLPGFPYMGEVDEQLNMPRKQTPVPVTAGSVGITGNQTGIYPLNSPGGWQIIGRTPRKLFDASADVPVQLKIGDYVKFYSISKEEMTSLSHDY